MSAPYCAFASQALALLRHKRAVGRATARFSADSVRKIAPRGCGAPQKMLRIFWGPRARCQTSQRDFAHPTNL